jgi:hypothetical protein
MNHTFSETQRFAARQIIENCLGDLDKVKKLDDHSIDIILELSSKMNVNEWLLNKAINLE